LAGGAILAFGRQLPMTTVQCRRVKYTSQHTPPPLFCSTADLVYIHSLTSVFYSRAEPGLPRWPHSAPVLINADTLIPTCHQQPASFHQEVHRMAVLFKQHLLEVLPRCAPWPAIIPWCVKSSDFMPFQLAHSIPQNTSPYNVSAARGRTVPSIVPSISDKVCQTSSSPR
jgi:hypothetical protein